ncbi:MAG TPA: transposase [Bradyrhizobium sp.]|nr:transposase [Bradyrhizobium sp.]
MQSIFSNALSRAVAKHIDLSVTRRETLSWLALLIMQHGTISLWRLAAFVASATQIASVRRRFYRFFQFVQLDGALAARVVVDLLRLGGKPWVLAIDRTNWDFGKTTINILMISVAWNGMGIPLLWMLLPTAGNSNTSERTELLDRLRAAFPDIKIAALMGDREFIGDTWMAFLHREKIPFILRLRENQYVLREGYAAMPISLIAQHLKVREKMIVKGFCWLGCQNETLSSSVRLVLMRLASGELLALACSRNPRHALAAYRQRWTIESMFANQRLRAGGHAHDRPGQTVHLARAHGFRRSARRQNRCGDGASAPHSRQKTWPQSLVAVRSRPVHAPQNLRRRKSRSSRRLPRPTAFPKTTHQTPAFFGFPIGSRVL